MAISNLSDFYATMAISTGTVISSSTATLSEASYTYAAPQTEASPLAQLLAKPAKLGAPTSKEAPQGAFAAMAALQPRKRRLLLCVECRLPDCMWSTWVDE